MKTVRASTTFIFVFLALPFISSCGNPLPDGYYLDYLDRGKSYLHYPDGSIVHGGIAEEVYYNKSKILLIAYEEAGELEKTTYSPPNWCIALLVDTKNRTLSRIEAEPAKALMNQMKQFKSSEDCQKLQ